MAIPTGYSRIQITLHWLVAALILPQFVLHDGISGAFRQLMQGGTPAFDWTVPAHIAGGIAILGLVVWRLSLRTSRGAPPPPAGPAWQVLAAHVAHWALYALLVLLPLSGIIAWFGAVGAAGEAHEIMTTLLLVLVAIHVLAALWHQFWLKDRLLVRMKRPG
jgi:cytochrome b561